MILVSLGNLGDLLIQAAFLRRLDREDVSVAVPASYGSIASELFSHASVIPLPDRLSDGRVLAAAQIDRAVAIARIVEELGRQHPGRIVKSIALTDDLILQRALNIYEAYWRLLGRDPDLASMLSPGGFPAGTDTWVPFDHLTRWTPLGNSRLVYFCPWGGIGVKNIPADVLLTLRDAAARLGCETRLLVSAKDDASAHPMFPPAQVVRLSETRLVHEAVSHLSQAALVVAVDTAWYHLAAMIGAPVLGISGPRSLVHFEFPGRTRARSLREQRLCADCFSTDRCVVTGASTCDAQPDGHQLIAAMEAHLTGATPPEIARATTPIGTPASVRRRAWRLAFHGIDLARTARLFRP
jgi:hypothetical protein